MKKYFIGFIIGILVSSVALADGIVADIASFKIFIKGVEFKSDNPPMVIDGRTYLPLRSIGEILNVAVKWDDVKKCVTIGETESIVDVVTNAESVSKTPSIEDLKKPYWICIKLPKDDRIYPVTLQSESLVDTKNGTCYTDTSTIVRILSLSTYAYELNERIDSAYPFMIDFDTYHYTCNTTGKVNNFNRVNLFIKEDLYPARQFIINDQLDKGEVNSVIFNKKYFIQLDKVLSFFDVKYDKISYDSEKDFIIIELSPSDKLKQIESD